MTRRPWTRDELILAMNLYCRLPFGRMHKGTPQIIELAVAIGRTPSSVAMKLSNLASLDEAHQQRGVKGLSGASAADCGIWNEFHADWDRLAVESEQLRESLRLPSEQPVEESVANESFIGPTDQQRIVNVRRAQRFFRRAVLASFNNRCCVSGIQLPELLIASHIVPWRQSLEHRANPRNGLCLSRLHDGAFDQGLMTIDEEMRIVISKELDDHCTNDVLHSCFKIFEGQAISLPHRFQPDSALLQKHREALFRG